MKGNDSAPLDAVSEALMAVRESKRIDFKRQFLADEPGAWCETIKDLVAMANSGGGVVIFGLDNDGRPSGLDSSDLLKTDPAELTDKIARYVGEQFDGFEILPVKKSGRKLVALRVNPRVGSPLVFEKPGTYSTASRRQQTAFARGTVYVRHGTKSEPANGRDLARLVDSEVSRQRREWNGNLRKIANAPKGSQVMIRPASGGPAGRVDRFRVVDDPEAPAVARTDFDITHPYRQKELIRTINERVGLQVAGPYQIQCVRRVFSIESRDEFFHRPKFGSPQYSDAFVSWLITEYQRDTAFFDKAVTADKKASESLEST